MRSEEEILATLDARGRVDALPFMPEMLQYCGRRFRVFKTAHKTCDTVQSYQSRRMTNAVHLEGLRCDGEAHGGCQAGCLLFWKEAWLKHALEPEAAARGQERGTRGDRLDALLRAARADSPEGDTEPHYSCQATELVAATSPLPAWDVRQYVRDLTSRNASPGEFLHYLFLAAYNAVMHLNWRGRPYPYVCGLAGERTPAEKLDLQPGEIVRVRPKDEIMATINARQRNRGLWFDVEMVAFCGGTYRVLRRVEKIINEKTGAMIHLPGVCLVLDGVVCSGHHSRGRLFCPRSIYPYWHEVWLQRLAPGPAGLTEPTPVAAHDAPTKREDGRDL